MDYQLYNAGDKIESSVHFSLSSEASDHSVGLWPFTLASKAFTSIPSELDLANGTTLRVEFAQDILRKHGHQGVVLIISEAEAEKRWGGAGIPENQAFATSGVAAEIRGEQMWKVYTRTIAENHIAEALESRGKGGILRKAQGFTARCLALHALMDPADELFARLSAGNAVDTDAKIAELNAKLNQLLSVPGVKQALAKAKE